MLSRRSLIASAPLAAVVAGKASPQSPPARHRGPDRTGGVLGAGDWLVERDLTIEGDLLLMPGAKIVVASGARLLIKGGFDAPISHVFGGAGVVDLNASPIPAAFPEWWGAKVGDGIYDNLAPLTACIAAHPVMQLQAGDYFIPDTWKITRSNCTIRGTGKNWREGARSTRIIVGRARAGSADVVQIGMDRQPPSVNDYVFNVQLSDVHLTRDGVVGPGPADRPERGAAGLRLQFCVEVDVQRISTENNAIGFYVGGVVHSFLRHCNAGRSIRGTSGNADTFVGIYLDGDTPGGFAGGNASIYIQDCAISGSGSAGPVHATALLLKGAFADSYITNFECAACQVGIRLQGNIATSDAGRRKSGNGDVHIIMPILDQVLEGIRLEGLTDHAMVDITSAYVAVATGGIAALAATECAGQVTMTGGQLIGPGDAEPRGRAVGFAAERWRGFNVNGVKLRGFARPVILSECADFVLSGSVHNPDQRSAAPSILVRASERGRVDMGVTGAVGAFGSGVDMAGGSRNIVVDATRIDPAAIASAQAIVRIDGAAITQPGPIAKNLLTGLIG